MHNDRLSRAVPPVRPLRLAWEYLVFHCGLIYFGVLGLAFTCLCAVLYLLLPRQVGMRFGRHAVGFLFRTYLAMLQSTGLLRVDARALDALRYEPGVIIAPNHPCLLDAMLVISRIPQVGCIMKADIWDNPVLGGGARLVAYIGNDSPRKMVRRAIQELKAGQALLVFPEGTRTESGRLNRFRGGFALMAKRARAPVQTVFIETNSAFLSKGWPLLRKPALPLEYRVRLGRRFEVTGNLHEFLAGLERYYLEELGANRGAAQAGRERVSAAKIEPREESPA
jgi:1-acyl-sn-glycerol-3-phosphate acyltransferase